METTQIVALLIAERDRINAAIEALEGPTQQHRGRPAKNAAAPIAASEDATMPDSSESAAAKTPATKKRTFTAAQRKQQGERMKAYWKAKKKAATKAA